MAPGTRKTGLRPALFKLIDMYANNAKDTLVILHTGGQLRTNKNSFHVFPPTFTLCLASTEYQHG